MLYSILPIEYEKVPDKNHLVGIIGNQVKILNGPAAVKQEYPSKNKTRNKPDSYIECGMYGINEVTVSSSVWEDEKDMLIAKSENLPFYKNC